MGGNSGGGGNGGRSGGGIEQELSALQAESSALYAKKKMLWATSKTHLSKEETERLEAIAPRIHDLDIMVRNPVLGKQMIAEGDRASRLQNAPYVGHKSTAAEKRRQWEMDHPL